MPSGTQVIDLDNGAPASSTASHNMASSSTITILNPLSALTTPQASSPPPHESSTSTTVSNSTAHGSNAAANLSSKLHSPSASDLSGSSIMQGLQTNTRSTVPEKPTPSSDNPPLLTSHASIPGMLTSSKSNIPLTDVTQFRFCQYQMMPMPMPMLTLCHLLPP